MLPTEIAGVLLAMPPRSAQVLAHRFLEALPREACASLYGVTPEAFDVLLLRAACDFDGAHAQRPFELEQRAASALRMEIDTGTHPLCELTRHRDEVRGLLDETEAETERSPARRRETALRWIAIVVIAALSLYFYLQQREREQSRRHAPAPAEIDR